MLAGYPRIRKVVYAIFSVVGLVLTSIQVAIVALPAEQPAWLTVALAVFAFVGVQVGFTANSNTNPPKPE